MCASLGYFIYDFIWSAIELKCNCISANLVSQSIFQVSLLHDRRTCDVTSSFHKYSDNVRQLMDGSFSNWGFRDNIWKWNIIYISQCKFSFFFGFVLILHLLVLLLLAMMLDQKKIIYINILLLLFISIYLFKFLSFI